MKENEKLFGKMSSHLAEYDYLTGLPNRRGLYEFYDILESKDSIHTMFIDIDNFKRVNDIYGHSMGDELLICIAKLIEENVSGFTSRIGGDEFVALIDGNMTEDELKSTAETLLRQMENIDFRKDILSNVSLSIGIVTRQRVSTMLDDILHKCDSAMYEAKYDGKNRYVFFRENDKKVQRNRNMEIEMDDALKNGEFIAYLQPKVNMISTKLTGAEALSRWNHPDDGIRTPGVYISLFEKNGFISKLDMYMFEEVCRIKKSWKGKKYEHIPVSVNMSRLHLYNKKFPDMLVEIADRYGIDHSELEIEITESVFVKDSEELIRNVKMLKDRHFIVSIDDFGSGFSALNLLKDLPVDIIKIDQEFLNSSGDDDRGKKVLRNVINMCKDLKLDVVTEGIETEEQRDFIVRCGCQIAQGYFYSKPLPVDEFDKFANEYITNDDTSYVFRLNGNVKSDDGKLEADTKCFSELKFDTGIFKESKALVFPGGPKEKQVIELPHEILSSDSFMVSMWIYPTEEHSWRCALYVKYETGFFGMIPIAWEGHSSFRIRDSKEVDGWYDISGCKLQVNEWSHYVVSYNAKTETAYAYINGQLVGSMKNVPGNRYAKRIVLGGDVFQPSFIGKICEVTFYNEIRDHDFVSELHQSYVTRDDFIGFEIGIDK